MNLPLLVSDKWYDIRDLGNLSGAILDQLDRVLPYGLVYVVAILIGFVASFLLFVLPTQLFLGVLGERKIIGRIQSRYGPNRVGPFGTLQPIADALKLIQKEALIPKASDRWVMLVAPVVFVAPAVLLFAVLPFGPNMVIADIPVSLIYFLAVSSLPVLGAFMAGWSGNNKYSLFGAMRIVAMAISYEVPLVMGLLGVALLSGTLSLQGMVFWQKDVHLWMVFLQPIAFAVYFICVSAELNRTPADIAEAESEIVAGYLTEYSGMQWGLFYGMDIGYALAAAAFASTVFLGGWSMWGLEEYIPSWLIFALKTQGFYLLFLWTRGTLPRLRIDQLMAFAWKFLLPLALLNLLIVATEKVVWAESEAGDAIVFLFAPLNILLAVLLVIAWAKVNGYKPENTPTKPRMVKDATGYIPVSGGGR